MLIIIIIYVIVTILELIYFKYYSKSWRTTLLDGDIDHIEFNNANSNELDLHFSKIIKKEISKLKDIYYIDWVADLNAKDNCVINYKNRKYHIAIWEKTQSDSEFSQELDFILRTNYIPKLFNLSYSDVVKEINDDFIIFDRLSSGENVVHNMWKMSSTITGTNNLDYYWISAHNHTPIKKHSVFAKFKKVVDEHNTIEGIILIGYANEQLNDTNSEIYYDNISIGFKIFMSLFILITTIGLDYTTNHDHMIKSLIFFFVLNIYVCTFMSSISITTTVDIEQENIKDLNDGILGIAFLVAVNIFIIDTMNKNTSTLKKLERKVAYNESALLFCVSLILLLMSMFKQTNYVTINDVREKIIRSQLCFNMAIIVNLFIFVNYLTFITPTKLNL